MTPDAPAAGYVVTVTDPRRRGHRLAVHADLPAADAWELAAVYRALGYSVADVTVSPPASRRAA